MPYANLDSFRLYYEDYQLIKAQLSSSTDFSQEVVPLIFLHGFTLDRRMWQPQVDFFRKEHRVILMDSRGHGLSDAPKTGYSRADRVDDLQRFVDFLKIDRYHLVGLSMGGSTAIGYALKYQQRLATLTLASAGAAGYDITKKIARIDQIARDKGVEAARLKWKDITLTWYKRGKEKLRALMETMIDDHSGAVWLDPMRGRYPREYDLERVHTITVPTRIIVGEADQLFLPLAEMLHERILNGSLSIYADVGHMVNLEAPERFNQELKLFLDELQ